MRGTRLAQNYWEWLKKKILNGRWLQGRLPPFEGTAKTSPSPEAAHKAR